MWLRVVIVYMYDFIFLLWIFRTEILMSKVTAECCICVCRQCMHNEQKSYFDWFFSSGFCCKRDKNHRWYSFIHLLISFILLSHTVVASHRDQEAVILDINLDTFIDWKSSLATRPLFKSSVFLLLYFFSLKPFYLLTLHCLFLHFTTSWCVLIQQRHANDLHVLTHTTILYRSAWVHQKLPVKKLRILLEQSFRPTAHLPLLTATSTFRLGRTWEDSLQQC